MLEHQTRWFLILPMRIPFPSQPLAWILLLGIGLSMTQCKSKPSNGPDGAKKSDKKGPSKVQGFIVEPVAITNDIDVPGTISPLETVNIQPEISGLVTRISFQEGAAVKAGSVLVKLKDDDLQAQLRKIQVQLVISKKTEERQRELLSINGISQQEYDLSLLSVKSLEADIDILRANIAKTEIRAPFSGVVGLRNISLGALVTPQTTVTTLRQIESPTLLFTVPERYTRSLTPGSTIRFTVDGSNDTYGATILASENSVSEDTRSLRLKARVNNGAGLLPGTFARVVVSLGKNNQALMIPSQAIIPQARGKKVMVCRNGLASAETVTTGLRDSARVEITSGLKIGDTILISGLMSIKPGSPVSPLFPGTQTPANK